MTKVSGTNFDNPSWTAEEKERLRARYTDGSIRVKDIAAEFGRSVEAIQQMARKLELTKSLRKHCKRGHPLIDGNIRWSKNGSRDCVLCAQFRYRSITSPSMHSSKNEQINRLRDALMEVVAENSQLRAELVTLRAR